MMETENSAPRDSQRSERGWAAAGLVLLALLLGFAFWRAGGEESLNCDDIYTLVLIDNAPAEVVDLTSIDLHPPGYYLLLKGWVNFGKIWMGAPGILWARMPGFFGMIVLVAVGLTVGRRMFGPSGGVLLTAAIVASAQTASLMNVLRSYAIATPAVIVCFLLMGRIFQQARTGEGRGVWLWVAYGVAGTVALWNHLLTSLILFFLGLWWFALAAALARRNGAGRTLRSAFFVGGAVTQFMVVLLYVPWLMHLNQQLETLDGPRRDWLTPTTVANFFNVFFLWYPWGPIGGLWPAGVTAAKGAMLGIPTLLVPAFALWIGRRRTADGTANAARLLAAMGLSIGFLNVLFLWGSDRLGIQFLFAATRYTVFSNAIWGAGLAGVALWAGRGRPGVSWLLIAPWFILNTIGQVAEGISPWKGWVRSAIEHPSSMMPASGSTLYVMPECLIPYLRQTLGDYELRPAAAVLDAEGGEAKHLLQVNMWSDIDGNEDKVLQAFLRSREAHGGVDRVVFPPSAPSWNTFMLWRIHRLDPGAEEEIRRTGLSVKTRKHRADALLTVDARALRCRDGWNSLAVGENLVGMRWSRAEQASISLGRALAPGEYELELNILRNEAPGSTTTLWVQLEGESQRTEVPLRGGWHSLRTRITATKAHPDPVLMLGHPLIRLPDYDPAAADARPMGILFYDLAVVPAPEGAK